MLSDKNTIKMIFGFKVKYLRQQLGLSYQALSQKTGLSTSYLHDIEKGRKYPKVDKIAALATALEVEYDFLVSTRASKKLQPVIDLLDSDVLKEFPLDLFGISQEKLFELFSNAPDKVTAFIRTIFKITRNYQMQRENIYLAALRSYQDMYDNYFEELEQAVRAFRQEHQIGTGLAVNSKRLVEILSEAYGVHTDRSALRKQQALSGRRSYFSAANRTLHLNAGLSSAQENFLLGRELAFQYLDLQPRPYLTRTEELNRFETLLNNFRASYFSVALLMDEDQLTNDLRSIASSAQWNPDSLISLLQRYDVTAEMLLQRLTNLLPHHFGLKDLFFIRLAGEQQLRHFRMTKELHLSQLHNPYANESNEHYCRRWVSVNIIKNLQARQFVASGSQVLCDAQISEYHGTDNAYLCISMAKVGRAVPASVTVGLLITTELRRQFRFLDDPNLNRRTVNTTCERCAIADCEARAVPPSVIQLQEERAAERRAIEKLES